MKILVALALSTLMTGCVVAQEPAYVCNGYIDASGTCVVAEVVYEPDIFVGGYYIGFYRPGFGFWTGYGWDVDFYAYGHPGYGHFYRGAPRVYYHTYVSGPHYRGHVGGHGHR